MKANWFVFVAGGAVLAGALGWQDAGLIRALEAIGGWLMASAILRWWGTL